MPTKLTLDQFMAGSLRNAHIRFGQLESYVRKDFRMIDGCLKPVLTRASTKNLRRQSNMWIKGRPKRTGLYSDLDAAMTSAAREASFAGVYVENVLNDFLPAVLIRYGYTEIAGLEGLPCFFKRV